MSAQTPTSPHLVLTSDSTLAVERRRVPRVTVTGELFKNAGNGRVYTVCDLSTGGMCLRLLEGDDRALFTVQAYLSGTLNLRGEKFPVAARVRHVGAERIGCQFESMSASVESALAEALDPTKLGAGLRAMPVAGPGSHWYRGPSGTDLIWEEASNGGMVRVLLTFLESFVSWESDGGLTTGRVMPSSKASEASGLLLWETLDLASDAGVDAEKLRIAKTILLSSNLKKELKDELEGRLAGHGS